MTITIHTGLSGSNEIIMIDWFDENGNDFQEILEIKVKEQDKPRELEFILNSLKVAEISSEDRGVKMDKDLKIKELEEEIERLNITIKTEKILTDTNILNLQKRLESFYAELTKEDIQKIIGYDLNLEEKPKFNEPLKLEDGERIFYVDVQGFVQEVLFNNQLELLNFGNFFKTKEEAEQRAKEWKVYNLLKNFSEANGGNHIDKKNREQHKFFIYWNIENDDFQIASDTNLYDFNVAYFISEQVAEEALRIYRTELEELVK